MPVPQGTPGVEAVAYNGEPDQASFEKLNTLIEAGPFKVHIAQTFPLNEVIAAHEAMEQHHLGRMALKIG
jgi:NADPH:quinone reductase